MKTPKKIFTNYTTEHSPLVYVCAATRKSIVPSAPWRLKFPELGPPRAERDGCAGVQWRGPPRLSCVFVFCCTLSRVHNRSLSEAPRGVLHRRHIATRQLLAAPAEGSRAHPTTARARAPYDNLPIVLPRPMRRLLPPPATCGCLHAPCQRWVYTWLERERERCNDAGRTTTSPRTTLDCHWGCRTIAFSLVFLFSSCFTDFDFFYFSSSFLLENYQTVYCFFG